MSIVVPYNATFGICGTLAGGLLKTLTLRLWQNNWFPLETDVWTDYVEATYSGYGSILTNGVWTPESNINGYGRASYPPLGIPHSGGAVTNLVYGYALTEGAGPNLFWSERFDDGPYTMATLGDNIITTARLALRSEFGQVP